jgi:hypothetical protein
MRKIKQTKKSYIARKQEILEMHADEVGYARRCKASTKKGSYAVLSMCGRESIIRFVLSTLPEGTYELEAFRSCLSQYSFFYKSYSRLAEHLGLFAARYPEILSISDSNQIVLEKLL